MTATLTANVNDALADRAKAIAEAENRSMSNVISNALIVFSELPRELRDTLLALRTSDEALFLDMSREMMAYVSRARFQAAARLVASQLPQDDLADDAEDIEIMEAATRMSRGA